MESSEDESEGREASERDGEGVVGTGENTVFVGAKCTRFCMGV